MKQFLYLIATDQVSGGAVSVVKMVLWVLSWIYTFLIALRRILYKIGLFKQYQLPRPVISVGNLTVGGVGKTPLVGFITQALKEKGSQPVILMRGYMAKKKPNRGQSSDEAAMQRAKLDIPVLAGAGRVENAKMFLKKNTVDVFLLDDGFQHWRLSRDLDIVAIDATNPWGNGHVLPRGILREPKKTLSRADIFVLTKINLGRKRLAEIKTDLNMVNPKALIVESIHKPVGFSDLRSGAEFQTLSALGLKICAVCGIGSPDSFTKTLAELEADIGGHFAFMDHHTYCAEDIGSIVELCQRQEIKMIVTTEKDAVKLKPFMNMVPDDIRVLALKIEISIVNGEDVFLERIYRIL